MLLQEGSSMSIITISNPPPSLH